MPDFGRSAIFARRRRSESVFISPSLGALVHHPPRPAPQKTTHVCVLIRPGQVARIVARHLPGRTSCDIGTAPTRRRLKRKRALILAPRRRQGYPTTASQAVSSSTSCENWAGVQGMCTSGAIPRPSVTPIAPTMPACRLHHQSHGSHHSSSMRDTNLKIIILSAPTAANACMMLPVTRI